MWLRRTIGPLGVLGIAALTTGAGTPSPVALAAEEATAATPPPAVLRVADLGWLAGTWVGTLGGYPIEEHWSVPEGDEMLGMFRWNRPVPIYELLLIEDTPEGAVLRLRHFGPGLVAWEEKDAALLFRATGHGRCWAHFAEVGDDEEQTRLRYQRSPDGALVVELIDQRDGAESVLAFPFRSLVASAVEADCG